MAQPARTEGGQHVPSPATTWGFHRDVIALLRAPGRSLLRTCGARRIRTPASSQFNRSLDEVQTTRRSSSSAPLARGCSTCQAVAPAPWLRYVEGSQVELLSAHGRLRPRAGPAGRHPYPWRGVSEDGTLAAADVCAGRCCAKEHRVALWRFLSDRLGLIHAGWGVITGRGGRSVGHPGAYAPPVFSLPFEGLASLSEQQGSVAEVSRPYLRIG
jgi:hypothetical protein